MWLILCVTLRQLYTCNCHKCSMINSVFYQVYRAWHLCNRGTQFSWISKFPPLDLVFYMLYWVHLLLLGYVERPVIKTYICILDGLVSTDKETTTKIWGLFVCVCLSTYVLKEESVHWLFFHIFGWPWVSTKVWSLVSCSQKRLVGYLLIQDCMAFHRMKRNLSHRLRPVSYDHLTYREALLLLTFCEPWTRAMLECQKQR